ncbi:phosphotransferase enzyme family protein-like protein [Hypoxylon cercidicola]|nr:phosphotransferase enzyme family protein-like protein [Hypoxylon cercidicola]
MGYLDEILYDSNIEERHKFIKKFEAAREDVVLYVNNILGWKRVGQVHKILQSPRNIGYIIKRAKEDGGNGRPPSVVIRFSTLGSTYSPWGLEKVKNEDSPSQLGPFILMDFPDGVLLRDILKKPAENDKAPLIHNPDIDTRKLKFVHSQIADYMLQLSRLPFPSIGALSNDSGSWGVSRRPLTYDMNTLAADTGFPPDNLPTRPFNRASEYFNGRAKELWKHFDVQRNICETEEEDRQKIIARCRLAQLVPKYCIDDDNLSFRLFDDCFGPSNMLADPHTFQITAVFSFDFTNAMPYQYLYDVPHWLLLKSPHTWLESDDKAGFKKLFVPQMELFIQEVERAEMRLPPLDRAEPQLRLSTRMRESWHSGRFWFNYAMRVSVFADTVYWKALDDGRSQEMLNLTGLGRFAEAKVKQFKIYLEEWDKKTPIY